MVEDLELRECFNLPSSHPGRGLRMPILSTILENRVAPDRLVALSTHELCCMSYRINPVRTTASILSVHLFANKASSQPQGGTPFKTSDEILEIRGTHGHISVKVANKVEGNVFQ